MIKKHIELNAWWPVEGMCEVYEQIIYFKSVVRGAEHLSMGVFVTCSLTIGSDGQIGLGLD